MKQLCPPVLACLLLFVLTANAQTNIIEIQTNWPNGNYSNGNTNNPQTNDLPSSSYWYSSKATQFNGTNGTLVCGPIPAGSSMTWWTYFAPSNTPVTLSPSNTLQMTLNFTLMATGASNATRHLRFGLLYSGANQFTNAGTAPGAGIMGYAQQMNFGTVFGVAPLQANADTNVNAVHSIFSTSADFIQIGANGGGTTNDPGFADGVPYTIQMSISEKATNSVDITTTVIGSTLTNGFITQTVTDTNYCYTNFDTFCMRPNDGATVATNVTTTLFQIATFPTPAVLTPISVKATPFAPGSIVLTWNSSAGATYSIRRTNDVAAAAAGWPVIATGYPAGGASAGSLSYTDTVTSAAGYYRVSTP